MSVQAWVILGFVFMTGAEVSREYDAPTWVRGSLAWMAFGSLLYAFGIESGILP